MRRPNRSRDKKLLCTICVTGLLAAVPSVGRAATPADEPAVFIAGVWPDRIVFFDQVTESFTEGFRLRHGAITTSARTSDSRLVFAVTDRMESVEVIDPFRREIVDEVKLSEPGLRIRIRRVFPSHDGTKLYLRVIPVRIETDRFIRDEGYDVIVYDLEDRRIESRFMLPADVAARWDAFLHASEDGEHVYVVGKDIYKMRATDFTVEETIVVSKPLLAGYAPYGGLSLIPTVEHGIYYGLYRVEDSSQKKRMFGVTRLDLMEGTLDDFELGPSLRLSQLAISKDGKTGYAGLTDIVSFDMAAHRILNRREGFERGRTNNSMIVSHDGAKLYVSGVGDTMHVYDANTFELLESIFAGGDFMMPPVELRAVSTPSRADAGPP